MPLDRAERRLSAILSADVVGYSRLMTADESSTVRTITAYRTEISNLVADHRGRVVDATGDNALAEFPTALDAVEAAVEIQRVLKARNAGLPQDRRMYERPVDLQRQTIKPLTNRSITLALHKRRSWWPSVLK